MKLYKPLIHTETVHLTAVLSKKTQGLKFYFIQTWKTVSTSLNTLIPKVLQ